MFFLRTLLWTALLFSFADAESQEAALLKDVPGSYVLGPNDQISVEVIELPELNGKSYRIDSGGSVSLPLVGRLQAAGLTLTQFEETLTSRLKTQVRNPHLVTGLIETRSQPVSVMGFVSTPGTQQLSGTKTLFDVLAMAGGLKPDAGDLIKITRSRGEGPLPLAQSVPDPETGSTTAEVSVRDVVELRDQKANIIVRPYDEISVSRAHIVYVVGHVHKPGGFALAQRRTISAVEALSLAEGPLATAAPTRASILRISPNSTTREHIPINLKQILRGKAPDMELQPEDVLYVPDSTAKRASTRAAETALSTLSGLIIWRGL